MAKISSKLTTLNSDELPDVLFHLPSRYEDRGKISSIGNAELNSTVSVLGKVLSKEQDPVRRRLRIRLGDETGVLIVNFFNSGRVRERMFACGRWMVLRGKIRRRTSGEKEMNHPECFPPAEDGSVSRLVAVYPGIRGTSQAELRKRIESALNIIEDNPLEEILPADLGGEMMNINQALRVVHKPSADLLAKDADLLFSARRRLVLEELTAHIASRLKIRSSIKKMRSISVKVDPELLLNFVGSLPFTLTEDQREALSEILEDLSRNNPMIRLLHGDVGSGKTVIAALAALCVGSSGYQVAFLVPTETLAKQHAGNLRKWFGRFGVGIHLVRRKREGEDPQQEREEIARGSAAIAIGTHVLCQESMKFGRLALVIVDEQQKFGVLQRGELCRKGLDGDLHPHQLIMTATPIPRTLAISSYVLDVSSTGDALRRGRSVRTAVISNERRSELIEHVRQVYLRGENRTYWVCPLIRRSRRSALKAAEDLEEELRVALPQLEIGLVHGKLPPPRRDHLLEDFREGKIQLLITTNLVEVGMDVPAANIMIVENAERLGLSQLHQLRGRVGRDSQAGYCVLMYQNPLSRTAALRLEAVRRYDDGFSIAEKDLEIRGEGELLGTRQAGVLRFKVSDPVRDRELMPLALRSAKHILDRHPGLSRKLIRRWVDSGDQPPYLLVC